MFADKSERVRLVHFCREVTERYEVNDTLLLDIHNAALSDSEYVLLVEAFKNRKKVKDLPLGHPVKLYQSVWDEVSFDKELGVLMLHDRIVVPKAMQDSCLKTLPMSHHGISRT